jgi:hypothetical protein
MKIISNGECYIQGRDVEHIMYNNNDFTLNLCSDLLVNGKSHLEKDEYIKVENKALIDYIMAHSEIPDFEDLYSVNTKSLKREMSNLLDELLDESFSEDVIYSSKSEKLRKQRYIEYITEQIKEMIAFKENKSKVSYPSVPLPGGKSISNGEDIATESMNHGEVLVYSKQNSQIDEATIDNEFLRVAYAILTDMNDISLDEIDLQKINSRYLSLKQLNKQKNCIKRVMKQN